MERRGQEGESLYLLISFPPKCNLYELNNHNNSVNCHSEARGGRCVAVRGPGRPITAGRHGVVGGVGSKGLAGRLSRLLVV